jgi:anti-sigma regulatory factor (Ser/Thr protein kinase)
MHEASRSFAGDGPSVGAARRFAAEMAEQWQLEELGWPVVQVISELASNAVIHARTDFTVRLSFDGGLFTVEVLDSSPRRAHARAYGADATTGRGLRMVEQLSRSWGVSTSGAGKAVWAVIDATAVIDLDSDQVLDGFLDGDDDEALQAAGLPGHPDDGSPANARLAA